MGVKTYFMEPVMMRRLWLRVYRYRDGESCPANKGRCCEAMVQLGDEPFEWQIDREDGWRTYPPTPTIPRQDTRWPNTCEKCHRSFEDQDTFQVFQDQLYRRLGSGELVAKRFAPAGALWFLDGQERRYYEGIFPGGGPDGQFLMARTPGGDWCIDSRASNCTMKTDKVHRCWVRHGDPKTGKVTVDKNGNTCQAGGGSIISGGYHGFLRNGEFVPA